MSKLKKEHQFLDLSDYMRNPARVVATWFLPTPFRAITFTWLFFICGLLSCYFIVQERPFFAVLCLLLKILFDTVDGEIARLSNEPRYTGRYLDSNCDLVLNASFFYSFYLIDGSHFWLYTLSFLSLSLQCSLYNYYYVVKRAATNGDTTSRVFEFKAPKAFDYESQFWVNVLHKVYLFFYGWQDLIVHCFDSNVKGDSLSKGFLCAVSVFGLGIQLLAIIIFILLKSPLLAIVYFLGISNVYVVFLVVYRKLFYK
ncbi:CDP-alcohol phosphatidyltransferase [Candidatus Marinamargulisbacteria bacterium SCGC AAA071-K20]|nr:CDP-alcohol phosphatidyltransferase [Candidatus Marinamargulisbacteria bacterium SCGC AAA071-K20]